MFNPSESSSKIFAYDLRILTANRADEIWSLASPQKIFANSNRPNKIAYIKSSRPALSNKVVSSESASSELSVNSNFPSQLNFKYIFKIKNFNFYFIRTITCISLKGDIENLCSNMFLINTCIISPMSSNCKTCVNFFSVSLNFIFNSFLYKVERYPSGTCFL